MKNKAAEIVSELIAGRRAKNIVIGGKFYTLLSPTIITICKAISEFAKIDIDMDNPISEEIIRVPEALSHICRGLAYALTAGETDDKTIDDTMKSIMRGTPEEIASAFEAFLQMSSMQEVFQIAVSAMRFAEAAAKQK